MAITHTTIKAPGQTLAAIADWNANHSGSLNHGTELTNVTANQHHAQSHTITSHSDIVDATGAQVEELTGGGDTTLHDHDGISENTAARHTRQHAITTAADHTSTATPAQILKADANGLPVDAANTDGEVSAAVTASHARQHAIDSATDHTSTITQNNLMDADANGLPDDSGLTVANTSDAIAKKHTQNTDTILGTDCVSLDHGAAATDMVVNVCYGTGAPPAANTTTIGSLFVKYTA